MGYVLGPLIAMVVLSLTLGWIERRSGAQKPPLRSRKTDVAYWLAQAWVFGPATKVLLFIALVPAAILVSVARGRPLEQVALGHGPFLTLPSWAQFVLTLLVADLVGYAAHRAFHHAALWRAHAIHHSSEHLDWLSAARNHPLNELVPRLLQAWAVLAIGAPVDVLAWATPVFALHGLLLHAQVPWDFGPLRYVIASPKFHRWHHSSEPAARDKNFAGIFAFIDVLFGTFYLPKDAQPTRFGIDQRMPEGLLAQMRWPFAPRPPSRR